MQFPALVDLTCKQVTELAHAYMTPAGLCAVDRARFEQHLHACTWCMTYMQQLNQTIHAVRGLADAPAPPDPTEVLAWFRKVALPSVATAEDGAASPPDCGPALPTDCGSASPTAESTGSASVAFKFLAHGAVGALSGFVWPPPHDASPGAWVEVEGPLAPCERGIHACGAAQLAHWLHDTLWVVELGGACRDSVDGVVAARGRLLHEIAAWRLGGGARFAQAAYDHAHAQVHESPAPAPDALRCLASAARHLPRGNVALAAFCAAMAVARMVGVTRFDQAAYDAERRHQSMLIVRELGLTSSLRRPPP